MVIVVADGVEEGHVHSDARVYSHVIVCVEAMGKWACF